jgi:uncharacterized coiled-coil DUF342 family protein
MADEILSPTIEEAAPKVEPEPVVNEQMTEEAQLLEKLKAAGMNTPEKVDGAIRNATKTFEMQSERDQLANQLREMQAQISEAQKPRQPQNEYDGSARRLKRTGKKPVGSKPRFSNSR